MLCFRFFARTDRRAQCFGLKELNLHLRNDVRTADIYIYIYIYIYEKSTVRLTSVGLAQARPNYRSRPLSKRLFFNALPRKSPGIPRKSPDLPRKSTDLAEKPERPDLPHKSPERLDVPEKKKPQRPKPPSEDKLRNLCRTVSSGKPNYGKKMEGGIEDSTINHVSDADGSVERAVPSVKVSEEATPEQQSAAERVLKWGVTVSNKVDVRAKTTPTKLKSRPLCDASLVGSFEVRGRGYC